MGCPSTPYTQVIEGDTDRFGGDAVWITDLEITGIMVSQLPNKVHQSMGTCTEPLSLRMTSQLLEWSLRLLLVLLGGR